MNLAGSQNNLGLAGFSGGIHLIGETNESSADFFEPLFSLRRLGRRARLIVASVDLNARVTLSWVPLTGPIVIDDYVPDIPDVQVHLNNSLTVY